MVVQDNKFNNILGVLRMAESEIPRFAVNPTGRSRVIQGRSIHEVKLNLSSGDEVVMAAGLEDHGMGIVLTKQGFSQIADGKPIFDLGDRQQEWENYFGVSWGGEQVGSTRTPTSFSMGEHQVEAGKLTLELAEQVFGNKS